MHAERTERYLTGQRISDETVLKGALATLLDEVQPHPDPEHADVAYRKRLAGNLLYKVWPGFSARNESICQSSAAELDSLER